MRVVGDAGCKHSSILSSKDDGVVRNLKITYTLHIIIFVGLEWAVKRKAYRVWSLFMSKKSIVQGREGQHVILHEAYHFMSF